jgi:hypothetical protein
MNAQRIPEAEAPEAFEHSQLFKAQVGPGSPWRPGVSGAAKGACWLVAASIVVVLAAPSPVQAQLVVSESGTPTYSHPIAVPPGVAGMTPSLGLYYSGGGLNGPVGHGWSVQGLSVITRCPATQATDGRGGSVAYTGADKLCMDGQRLIQTDETGNPRATANSAGVPVATQVNDAQGLGTEYREFRTEKESHARIRAYGYASGDTTGASGPRYFKVWTKAGQVYEYGAAPLGRCQHTGADHRAGQDRGHGLGGGAHQ